MHRKGDSNNIFKKSIQCRGGVKRVTQTLLSHTPSAFILIDLTKNWQQGYYYAHYNIDII